MKLSCDLLRWHDLSYRDIELLSVGNEYHDLHVAGKRRKFESGANSLVSKEPLNCRYKVFCGLFLLVCFQRGNLISSQTSPSGLFAPGGSGTRKAKPPGSLQSFSARMGKRLLPNKCFLCVPLGLL